MPADEQLIMNQGAALQPPNPLTTAAKTGGPTKCPTWEPCMSRPWLVPTKEGLGAEVTAPSITVAGTMPPMPANKRHSA